MANQANQNFPKDFGFYQPAEWQKHKAVWSAWPDAEDLWLTDLSQAQQEFTALCRALALQEQLEILVTNSQSLKNAEKALTGLNVRFHPIPYGDIWLRDTGPIFLQHRHSNERAVVSFKFNGWGEKYLLPHDDLVATRIAEQTGIRHFHLPIILEGGSLEVDGQGTCLTTKQCLLNRNRNPKMNKTEIESYVQNALGVEKILWLEEGLLNDHTDAHIDNLARFISPGKVICMRPANAKDPNSAVLKRIAVDLSKMTDAMGQRLEVIEIPSPGLILNEDEEPMPASYMNFYIGNGTVVVPIYETEFDDEAIDNISQLFPAHRVVGLPAKTILTGGGSFHCITQQEPI